MTDNVRYTITKEETCPKCDGTGEVHGAEYGGWAECPKCEGVGAWRTQTDADEWLAQALVRIGLYGDGK